MISIWRGGWHLNDEGRLYVESICLEPWPNVGGSLFDPNDRGPHNVWYHYADRFVDLVKNFQGFWLRDSDLKYLNVRIDTRNNRFVLGIDGSTEHISPDRVVAAVKAYQDFLWKPVRKSNGTA